MEWIVDVAVPLILGFASAFGAAMYTNRRSAARERANEYTRAADALRAYIQALRETSDHLEARAQSYGNWDATKELISHGGLEAVRAAYSVAKPYFHRFDVRQEDGNPLRNEFPSYGEDPMQGSENFHDRANQIEAILNRGFK